MKQIRFAFATGLLLLVAFFTQNLFGYSFEETFKKKIDLSPGSLVSVEHGNGTIEVNSWDQNQIQIEAVKKIKASGKEKARQLMEELEIDISQNGNEMRIRTRHPGEGHSGLLEWIFGNGGSSSSVEYKINVPQKVDLDLRSTNGAIRVKRVEGMLRLHTTNGKIQAEDIRGEVDASTTNGSITVYFDDIPNSKRMEFHTTNGSIKVYMPDTIRGNIEAKTTNGSIHTDFPLTVEGKFNSKHVSGSINGGGSLMDFRTTNGSIGIYKQ